MGKSFVFRDRNGRLCGYLMQSNGKILCRAGGISGGDCLTVVNEAGGIRIYALPPEGAEGEWDDEGKHIAGGYITDGCDLLADTGNPAKRAFASAQAAEAPRKTEMHSLEETEETALECRRETAHGWQESRWEWPERRWPPPALLANGEYRDGRWIQRTEN